MTADQEFQASGAVWRWRSTGQTTGGWYFLTVDGQTAAEIRFAGLGLTGGFGSVKVTAQVGDTVWTTSLFPHKESGGFLLPLKADVRRREKIDEGSTICVSLKL